MRCLHALRLLFWTSAPPSLSGTAALGRFKLDYFAWAVRHRRPRNPWRWVRGRRRATRGFHCHGPSGGSRLFSSTRGSINFATLAAIEASRANGRPLCGSGWIRGLCGGHRRHSSLTLRVGRTAGGGGTGRWSWLDGELGLAESWRGGQRGCGSASGGARAWDNIVAHGLGGWSSESGPESWDAVAERRVGDGHHRGRIK